MNSEPRRCRSMFSWLAFYSPWATVTCLQGRSRAGNIFSHPVTHTLTFFPSSGAWQMGCNNMIGEMWIYIGSLNKEHRTSAPCYIHPLVWCVLTSRQNHHIISSVLSHYQSKLLIFCIKRIIALCNMQSELLWTVIVNSFPTVRKEHDHTNRKWIVKSGQK